MESEFQALDLKIKKNLYPSEQTTPSFFFIFAVWTYGAARRYTPFSNAWNGRVRFIFLVGRGKVQIQIDRGCLAVRCISGSV